ncbi:MAG: hypothetical protein Q9184_000499 [Pyrenodesmia sp. 2 TL-2023]
MPAIPNVPLPQHSQPPPPSLNILKLVDASLRYTIGGIPAPSKTTKKGAPSGVRLMKTSLSPSLADISPALFRPGYLKVTPTHCLPFSSQLPLTSQLTANTHQAIAARAPLISRIASSLASIAARPLIHSSPSEPEPKLEPEPSRPSSTSDLQSQLWRLLQKRKWPTTPLEPLDYDDVSVFERHARDEIIMFDPKDSQLEASNFYTHWPRVKIKENADMLDYHTPLYPGDGGMLEPDEGDEDLFSSLGSTHFSSQGLGEEEMILEEEEEGEEDLLLNEAESSHLFGTREVSSVPWLRDEGVWDVDLQEARFDGFIGAESDDGALQMLF